MKLIFAIVIIVIFTIFAISVNVQNPGAIAVKYYFGIEWSMKLATLILCTFVSGLFTGAALVGFSLIGQKFKTGRAKRKLNKVEKEVEGLRAASTDSVDS